MTKSADDYLTWLERRFERHAQCSLSDSQRTILRDHYGELARRAEKNPRIMEKGTALGKTLRRQADIAAEVAADLCVQRDGNEISESDLWGGITAAEGGCPLC